MNKKQGREYRNTKEIKTQESEKLINSEFYVEGYATTFNTPYLLYESNDGYKVYEQIDKNAFNDCDMSDVIMQYDHEGKVFARLSNGTLGITADDKGLFCYADLSQSAAAQELYREIKNGLITQMSFGFIIDTEEFSKDTSTRTILKVKKLFDVSAVSIPANADTNINARSYGEGVIAKAHKEFVERKMKILKLKIKTRSI